MQYAFGLGILSVTPPGANPTPVQIGTLQDVGFDIEFDIKMLYGAYQMPVDAARGKAKISGKAKTGQIGSGTVAAFLNASATTGSKIGVANESGQVVTNAYTVANGATFYEDLGVINTVNGLPMQRVASAPAAGQYSVNTATGAYTFAAADSNPLCLFCYSYTAAAAGKTVVFANQLMGASVTFSLSLFNNFRSKNYGCKMPAIIIPKLSFDFKQDDYATSDLDFTAMAATDGTVLTWWSTE